jgi:hypothetical protein
MAFTESASLVTASRPGLGTPDASVQYRQKGRTQGHDIKRLCFVAIQRLGSEAFVYKREMR